MIHEVDFFLYKSGDKFKFVQAKILQYIQCSFKQLVERTYLKITVDSIHQFAKATF